MIIIDDPLSDEIEFDHNLVIMWFEKTFQPTRMDGSIMCVAHSPLRLNVTIPTGDG